MPNAARVAVAPLALAVLAAPYAARAQGGVTFTYRVQSTANARDAQSKNEPSANMLATVRMSGGNARMDFREGSMPMTGNGGYVLIRGAQQQLVFVNAKDKQAMIIGADGLGSGFGALTNNALIKITMRDPKFSYEELGPGEKILGMPTRRVRTHNAMAMDVRVAFKSQHTVDSTESEQWIAPRPAGLDADALMAWGKAFGNGVRRTNPELAQQMTDYQRKYGDGLALRSVTVTRRSDDKGRATVDTARMEVTELSRGPIPASVFDIPSDYQVTDMRQMAASMDSARRANGDSGSAKGTEGARPSAREAIGGLFRRKKN